MTRTWRFHLECAALFVSRLAPTGENGVYECCVSPESLWESACWRLGLHRQQRTQPGISSSICRYSDCSCVASTLLRPRRIGPRSMSITSPGQSSAGNAGQSFNRPSVTNSNRCCSAGKRFCRAASQCPASPNAASNGVPPPAPSPSSQWRKPLEAFKPCTCHFGNEPLAVSNARRARWR
jgi:hypothetical protein